MQRVDIVVTTIFEPAWLQGYLDNIEAHGHAEAVTIRVICDRRTPVSVPTAAAAAGRQGFAVDCPTLDEQEAYLRRIGLPEGFVPWDSDNRRNIGFLRAWENGADVLISIDDDNYCRPDSDFVGSHLVVGHPSGEVAERSAGGGRWFNVASLLHGPAIDSCYARGFPYAARGTDELATTSPVPIEVAPLPVAVNAGLWLEDPDVDAVTRLALRPRATSTDPGSVVLAPGTWSPINTQNTAIVRRAIPAYYYVRMGFALQGTRIDRFGDILSGYLLETCAEHLGETVVFGAPVADHLRSPHNLFKDLYHELAGMVVIEELVPWLRELPLSGGGYAECYTEVADALAEQSSSFSGFVWDDGGRAFLRETADCMATWLRALRSLEGL